MSAPAATIGQRLVPYLVIGVGAAVGANARYGLGQLAAQWWPGAFPWGTLLINVSGALALCLLLAILRRQRHEPPHLRLLLGTGFCGAFTTFSTFSVELLTLLHTGRWPLAVAYVAASLLLGYAAGWLGLWLGRR